MALACVSPGQVVTISMPAQHCNLAALVNIFARPVFLPPKSWMALALVASLGVKTDLGTASVIASGAFVNVQASFPVRAETESLRAEAEHLAVAVDALVRAAAVISITAVRVLATMAIRGKHRADEVVARTLVSTRCVDASVLARSVPIVQKTLVIVHTLSTSVVESIASLAIAHECPRLVDAHLRAATISAIFALIDIHTGQSIL